MGQKAATLRCCLGSPSAGRDYPELPGAPVVGVGEAAISACGDGG